jgi:DNA polymerase
MAHHIQLAQPQCLILLGQDIARILTGQDMPRLRGRQFDINQNEVSYPAIALPHPAMMLARPAHKAAAWDSLKHILRGKTL